MSLTTVFERHYASHDLVGRRNDDITTALADELREYISIFMVRYCHAGLCEMRLVNHLHGQISGTWRCRTARLSVNHSSW